MSDTKNPIADHAIYVSERTPLSPKEAEALLRKNLQSDTQSQKSLAESMGVSEGTFSGHLSNAEEKLNVRMSDYPPLRVFGLESVVINGRSTGRPNTMYVPIERTWELNVSLVLTQRIDKCWPEKFGQNVNEEILNKPEYRLHIRYSDVPESDVPTMHDHILTTMADDYGSLKQSIIEQLPSEGIPEAGQSRIQKLVTDALPLKSSNATSNTVIPPGTNERLKASFKSTFIYGEDAVPITFDDGNVTVVGINMTLPSPYDEVMDGEFYQSYIVVSVDDDFAETNDDVTEDAPMSDYSERHAKLVNEIEHAASDVAMAADEYAPIDKEGREAYSENLADVGIDVTDEDTTIFARNLPSHGM